MITAPAIPQFNPGDLVEIGTPQGVAYVEVTHDHPSYPQVVRGLHRPSGGAAPGIAGLRAGKTLFTVLVPLGEVLTALGWTARIIDSRRGSVAPYPSFRMAIRDQQGALLYWWVWDGSGLHPVSDTPGLDDLPMREVLSAGRFRDLIEGEVRDAA